MRLFVCLFALQPLVNEGSRGAPEAQLELASGASRTSLKPCSLVLYSNKLGEVQQLAVAGTLCTIVPRTLSGTRVSVRVVSPSSGTATIHEDLSWDNLRCITTSYSLPLTDISVIRLLSVMTESALATHAARRAVMSLLLAWPAGVPCTLAAVGGPGAMLSLAKVVAASENVFSQLGNEEGGGRSASSSSSPLMDLVKNRLKGFLQQESTTSARGRTLDATSLAGALIADCTRNVEQSTQPGDAGEVVSHESLHPHFPKCDYKGEVVFEGAKALSVSFHPMCEIASGSLSVLKGKGGDTLASFSTNSSFHSLVVHGDRLFFRFRADSDGSTPAWGYSFDVSPMRGLQVTLLRVLCCDVMLLGVL